MKDITFIIHTFKRPEQLQTLLDSIKIYYPRVPVIVYDDSNYDMGLSWGRNYLVSQVKTKYYLLLDDDFVFTEDTRVELLFKKIKKGYDIVAGSIIQDGTIRHYEGYYEFEDGVLRNIPRHTEPLDFVFNFFLAKKEVSGWDNELKLAEHTAFFFKNKGKWKIGYEPGCLVEHRQIRVGEYAVLRSRAKQFLEKFMVDNYINEIISYNGTSYKLPPSKHRFLRNKKFSCILCTYNPNHVWLIRALKSTIDLFDEVIVVNDGTTHNIDGIINRFSHIKYIKHDTNKGFYEAKNTAIREATGNIICIVDDDDYFDREGVEKLKKFIEKDNESDIWHFNLRMFGNETGIYGVNADPTSLKQHSTIPGVSWFKKYVWEYIGGFNYPLAEDWDFWLRAYYRGFRFKYFPEIVYNCNRRDDSLSAKWTGEAFIKMREEILKKNENIIK